MSIKRDALFARTAEPHAADKHLSPMNITSSFISLENICFHASHGVMEQEKTVGGDFVVSVRVSYPTAKAMQSDDINDTLNYATLYKIIKEEMQKPSRLLEHVAGRIAENIFSAFPLADKLSVKITKQNPPIGGDMDGACIELHLERD